MKRRIVLTGILKSDHEILVVKRSEDEDFYPGVWEFPGGHLEEGELIIEGLKRELKEEISFIGDITPKITHYYDEIKKKGDIYIHNIEIDFLIEVNKDELNISLSNEHTEFKWVSKDSELLDDFIRAKIENVVF